MISAPRRLSAVIVGLMIPACAPSPSGTGPPSAPNPRATTIQWRVDDSGKAVVAVLGLDPRALEAMRSDDWSEVRLGGLFTVGVDPVGNSKTGLTRMAGSFRVGDAELQFRPLYALDRGVTYRALLNSHLFPYGVPRPNYRVVSDYTRPVRASPPTWISGVDPAGDILPENLLKLYIRFSAPMARGSAYEHVRILDEKAQAVDLPFLEIGEELWDPSGTRLTLLLDPGRIKRGLKPREESGPILESGRSYTFVVDSAWQDANGHPLAREFRKAFRAGPPDETQPDPKSWQVSSPKVGSKDPLSISFPEPLDRAMLEHALGVLDESGKTIAGRITVAEDAKRWEFAPDRPWEPGENKILVDTTLEDLCGNSIRRPFEIDATRPISDGPEAATVGLTFRPE